MKTNANLRFYDHRPSGCFDGDSCSICNSDIVDRCSVRIEREGPDVHICRGCAVEIARVIILKEMARPKKNPRSLVGKVVRDAMVIERQRRAAGKTGA